jgi:hypothetical protein
MSIKLAFRHNAGGIFSRAIRFITKSDDAVSHVEVIFPDGRSFSSREGSGASWEWIDYSTGWFIVELLDVPESLIAEAARWADAQVGRRYDYWGIVLYYFNKRNKSERLFCSEAAARIAQICGRFPEADPSLVSPQRLLDLARADYDARSRTK